MRFMIYIGVRYDNDSSKDRVQMQYVLQDML